MALPFPDIDPVALEIGPIVIRWYALAYLAGFLGGWYYANKLVSVSTFKRPNKDDIENFITWMVLGVIIGGRLGYILFYNAGYYFTNAVDILKLWEGGMSFHGGLIGASVAMILFSIKNKIPLFQLTDIIAVVSPIGLFFGRMANFINGELYGRPTEMPWGMVFPMSNDGLARHPSQLYEALTEGLLLFIVLNFMYMNKSIRAKAGIITGVFLIGYSVFRFLIEFVRQPDTHLGLLSLGMSMGQILSLPTFIAGIVIIYLCLNKSSSKT